MKKYDEMQGLDVIYSDKKTPSHYLLYL